MKKITFKKTMFLALSCMMLLTNNMLSQTQNYFGTSGTFNASVWSTNPAGNPTGTYNSALVTTGGAVINFGNTATTGVTGASITVAGINATQNVTINTIGGTISNYNNGIVTINISDNMTFDAGTQGFSASATAGYIKSGGGVFATGGNTYGGGFTLNAGTLIARGVNAMGANATPGTLTINGGIIAANATRNFTGKYSGITIGGDFTFGATTGLALTNANLTFNAATSLGSATRAITIGGTGIYTLGGVISGNAGVGLIVNANAAGYLLLSGANTYTGTTTINTGTLRLGSSSALGTVNGGTVINSTSISSGGILDLNGTNYSTAEPLTANGNGTGGGAIVNNVATDATFAGPITLGSGTVIAGGQAKINLTNTIDGTGSLTIGGGSGGVVSGAMSMAGALVVSGNWTISGVNSYTGSTTVGNTRVLLLGASGVIPDASSVILTGGTLQTGATTGFSETAGTLQLATNSSTIALGTGVHTLTFADSHLVTWTVAKTLTITGWTGDATTGATGGRIFFGSSDAGLTSTQLGQITFSGYAAGAQILSTGEIVPASLAAPTLTAAVGATVDGAFDVTFTDNSTWRGAITSITVVGTTLDPSAYNTTVAGKITFTPSASTLLQSAGSKNIIVLATNYFNGTLSQTIGAGVTTSNSTATIDASLAISNSRTITCTAKDQYNNLVSGYTFKYDLTVTNSDVTTAESYTIDGTAHTTTASDVTLAATTNSSGVATFSAALPVTVDGGDGLSIQVQLANGTTNIGSAFTFSSQTFNLVGTKYSNDLALNGISDVIVSSGELIVNSNPDVNSITVAPGAKLTLNSDQTLRTGTFTLQSSIAGTGTFVDANTDGGLTVTGTSTVNQNLSSPLRSWYMSSPVTSAQPTGMDRIKYYNEAANSWPTLYNSSVSTPVPYGENSFTTGKGYLVVPLSGNSISFTGALNAGEKSITLQKTVGTDKTGFNLIGNPYPSYLDWTLVYRDAANANKLVDGTMWYRTKVGTYTFWTVFVPPTGTVVSSPTEASNSIPPMQAFWVRTAADGNVLTLNKDMRAHAPASNKLLKAPSAINAAMPLVRLQVSNGANTDEAVIYFSANASNERDAYDAPKMSNENAAIPEIYTTLGTEQMVINGMKTIPMDQEIGLGFAAGDATSFSLKANEVRNLPKDVKLILKDNVTNAETDVTDGVTTYAFTPLATSGTRFSVIFRSAGAVTGLNSQDDNMLLAYSTHKNQITLVNNDVKSIGSTASVYNAVGQKLMSKQLIGSITLLDGNFTPGVYVVKVNNISKKVIVK
jgi:autotransporter-associated beta strand protein